MRSIKVAGLVIAGLLLATIVIVMAIGGRGAKFPAGRDTVKKFGDGTFQILRSDRNTDMLMSLEPPQQVIVRDVQRFKEKDRRVYIIGDGKYFILQYEAKNIQQYDKLDRMSRDDREEFEKLM